MLSNRSLPLALAAALAVAGSPQARATSASDAGARVVVPFVAYDKVSTSLAFVENHEIRDVEVQLRWVGERASGSPGMKLCGRVMLPAGSLSTFDLRQTCGLPGTDDRGMLVTLVTKRSGVARISARGRVDLLDAGSGLVLQTLVVDGLPLGSLDTTDAIHVASGLRNVPATTSGAVTTDCYFGTFMDGSRAGGVLGRLGLRDRRGQPLGSDVYFSVRPFELLRVADVFQKLGAPVGSYDDVRAEFFLAGGGDAVLGYCTTAQEFPAAKGDRTLSLAVAQVADPQDQTRRRSVSVGSTPEVQGGASFELTPANTRVVHGLFVQHPDHLRCGLSLSSTDDVVLTAVSPDRSVTVGGTNNTTGWFDAGPRGQLGGGFSDLWGLEVSWGPNATRAAPIRYTVSCDSGNGVSLADELFRNP